MLILNKLLPLLLLPPGLCLLLIIAGLNFHKRYLVRSGLVLLWVLGAPLAGESMLRCVEWPGRRIPVSQVRNADAVVVLSGMVNHIDGAPLGEWNDSADRFEGGLDLFRAGKAPLLVFTYGQVPWQTNEAPEGQFLARRAMLAGVPGNAIRVTGPGGNTSEEAVEVSKLPGIGKGAGKKIVLVTSAFHMRRAAMLFRRAGFDVEPYPVDFRARAGSVSILSFLPDATAQGQSALAIREVIGICFYLTKAKLEDAGILKRP
jgi:uncharacterized SAM-binding protein YcdF (DUF218 family)